MDKLVRLLRSGRIGGQLYTRSSLEGYVMGNGVAGRWSHGRFLDVLGRDRKSVGRHKEDA